MTNAPPNTAFSDPPRLDATGLIGMLVRSSQYYHRGQRLHRPSVTITDDSKAPDGMKPVV